MRGPLGRLAAAWVAALALASCARGRGEGPLVPSGYTGWAQTTRVPLTYPIPGHENHRRRIFINSVGLGVRIETRGGRRRYEYPVGTIVVKEVYPGLEAVPGEKPEALTVMIKRPDDPRSRGGWLWVVHTVATGEERIIDYEFCVECHANANEKHPYGDKNPDEEFRDYVYYPVEPQQGS